MSSGRIAIVDYGAGNLRSVQNAIAHLGFPHEVTADPDAVRRASTVVFPGVGEASSAMSVLVRTGLGDAIREAWGAGRRLIGICLGSQIILDRSEEGDTTCLGLLPGVVRCEGEFAAGEVVRICDLDGTEFARGIAGFDAGAIRERQFKRVEAQIVAEEALSLQEAQIETDVVGDDR